MCIRDRPVTLEFTSPRAWASALLGIDEYLQRLQGDRLVNHARESFTGKLMQCYANAASDDWQWFEDTVSYANARLPQALIRSAQRTNNEAALEIGLTTLRW